MTTEIALTLLRVFAGISFLYHGFPKVKNFKGTFQWLMKEKFPLPLLATIILSVGETLGGVFLILGIFVQPVAILLALIMTVAFFFHLKKGEGWKGAEHAATLAVIAIVLAIAGGGAWQLLPFSLYV
jgi:putative oxidoreductase